MRYLCNLPHISDESFLYYILNVWGNGSYSIVIFDDATALIEEEEEIWYLIQRS